ncbi:MAG: hypothetical protein HQ534_06070 [Armatimonadetes bacterium]|nr:hypothetical protein [Armatimonadota bacterium]
MELSKQEIQELLGKICWDIKIDKTLLYDLLLGNTNKISGMDRINLYTRLLTSYNWYLLLKIIPRKDIMIALSDDVIKRIFPKDLKKQYLYARKLLSENIVSNTG